MIDIVWVLKQDDSLFVTFVPHKNLSEQPLTLTKKRFKDEPTGEPDWKQISTVINQFQSETPSLINAMQTKFNKVA